MCWTEPLRPPVYGFFTETIQSLDRAEYFCPNKCSFHHLFLFPVQVIFPPPDTPVDSFLPLFSCDNHTLP